MLDVSTKGITTMRMLKRCFKGSFILVTAGMVLNGVAAEVPANGQRKAAAAIADSAVASESAKKVHAAKSKAAQKPKRKKVERLAPTFADVAYDVHERTVLDFWQAEGSGPRPLHVFIHGGGWIQGDKKSCKAPETYLKKGISVAAINYRLSGTDPLPVPVHDAARAIQFLRHNAKDWNIDPSKFVVSGGSAGGCTSLLLACLDDMADPDSEDPVARESTRVQGAAVAGAQTAIDPKLIEPWIGPNVLHAMIYMAVGEDSSEAAIKNYEKHEKLYKQFSSYYHISSDDPPLYLGYNANMSLPSKSFGHGIHHGMFGVKLKEKAESVGHKQVHLSIKGTDETKDYSSRDDFIFKRLLAR
jgi:arylformamidase